MLGMSFEQGILIRRGSGVYSRSFRIDLGLTNAICQVTLADFGEFGPESHCDLGFVSYEYLNTDGHTVHVDLPGVNATGAVHTFAHNRLLSATYVVQVSNAFASWVINMFFWESVH
jgi:hypothetical protein